MPVASKRGPVSRLLLELGPFRIWGLVAAVLAGSASVWTLGLTTLDSLQRPGGITLPWWSLAIFFYLTEAHVVHLHFRKQAHTLSFAEIGLVFGLFFASPAALLIGQATGVAAALIVRRRQKPVKFTFNLAELTLCSGIALFVFRSFAASTDSILRNWIVALTAAAIAHVLGVLLVAAVIAVAERHFDVPQLPYTLAVSLVGAVATSCLGLVGVELLANKPSALALLFIPAVACAFSFRAYLLQRERREHVEFLYESMRATQGAPEFGLAVGQLLVAARRLLRAEYAEILLLAPSPAEPLLRSTSGPGGETLMHPEAFDHLDAQALEAGGVAEHAVLLPRRREPHPLDGLLATRHLADAVIGPLRGDNKRLLGFLIVADRSGDVSSFTKDDLALFETFASHASVLLENGRLERSLAQLTELKEELHEQAYHDALTGLPNRLLFIERLNEALAGSGAHAESHAILYLDLDRFKIVNDNWGHDVGDDLLKQVAEGIRAAVRPSDTPARLGGDEFAILLEDTDGDGALRTAERLAEALASDFTVAGRTTRVHTSIGIALGTPGVTSPEELIRRADAAMYNAKNEGRASAVYNPHLHQRLRRRHQLALELEHAVERDQIHVHYQPAISLADGGIRAFEALARWQHPTRGLLPASEFLDIAEENGAIVAIGARVLDEALTAATRWQEEAGDGDTVDLWVNLAPAELTSERLVENLALAVTRTRFDPRHLTIEITESSLVRDEQHALAAIHKLRRLGVRLAIDDFGTGYSSLSRLADFPIEMLKIPKLFIDPLTEANADLSYVDAILRLADSLGLVTVGEGIEHLEQAQRLQRLGCTLVQGHLLSRPISAPHALQLLRTNRPSRLLPIAGGRAA